MLHTAAYFKRIGYRGPLDPSLTVLRDICSSHLRNVPFEVLDFFDGIAPPLELDGIFDKVVTRRCGGSCVELHGLLAHMLGEVGFDVTMAAGEVALPGGRYSSRPDHMVLLVQLPDSVRVVDVGFSGVSFVEPLRFNDSWQHQQGWEYRLKEFGNQYVVLRRDKSGKSRPLFRFSLQPRELSEFKEAVHHHSTSEESPFPRTLMCARITDSGKLTLINDRLTTADSGREQESTLADAASHERVLRRIFSGHDHLAHRALRLWRQRRPGLRTDGVVQQIGTYS